MREPAIIIGGLGDSGVHNQRIEQTRARLKQGRQYKDLSTIMVCPTRGSIPARVVESWLNLMSPMNNGFVRMFIERMEVGDAYNIAVETILAHPQLKDFKYMLTVEEDNLPPADGLLRLLEAICDCDKPCKEHFAQVAGLYFTKGEGGQPMIYGNPRTVLKFEPQVPVPNAVQECNGTGMGFTLYHLGLFRDKAIPKPWFKTVQENGAQGTQDLYFMGAVRRAGYRIASDNRVTVGHYDDSTGVIW